MCANRIPASTSRVNTQPCSAKLLALQWSIASSTDFTRTTGTTGPKGSSHASRMSCSVPGKQISALTSCSAVQQDEYAIGPTFSSHGARHSSVGNPDHLLTCPRQTSARPKATKIPTLILFLTLPAEARRLEILASLRSVSSIPTGDPKYRLSVQGSAS